ncbi:MAG: transposase [Pseudomonadota bacterium]
MPRRARLVLPDVALHVIQRGHNRAACFRHDTDRLVYLTLLHDLSRENGCALHAYCLMTNHVHLLFTPGDGHACAILMRNLGQRYVQHFNRRYERSGTLWEGRFRSCLVDSARYVLACYRYIELNPVRAGMVACAAAYPWSSHSANAGYIEDRSLSPHPEYLALSRDRTSRQTAYRQLLNEGDEPAFLAAIRDATNGGFPMIGERLKSQVTAMGRQLAPGRPGPAPARAEPGGDLFSGNLDL